MLYPCVNIIPGHLRTIHTEETPESEKAVDPRPGERVGRTDKNDTIHVKRVFRGCRIGETRPLGPVGRRPTRACIPLYRFWAPRRLCACVKYVWGQWFGEPVAQWVNVYVPGIQEPGKFYVPIIYVTKNPCTNFYSTWSFISARIGLVKPCLRVTSAFEIWIFEIIRPLTICRRNDKIKKQMFQNSNTNNNIVNS